MTLAAATAKQVHSFVVGMQVWLVLGREELKQQAHGLPAPRLTYHGLGGQWAVRIHPHLRPRVCVCAFAGV